MHAERAPRATRGLRGAVSLIALLTACAACAPGAAPVSDQSPRQQSASSNAPGAVLQSVTATMTELLPVIADQLGRQPITPSLCDDPTQLAPGLAASAVTEGIDRLAGTASDYRLIIDGGALAQSEDIAVRALLAHEIVHLYLQPITHPNTDLWLVEGIADFVGYRAAGVDRSTVIASIEAPPQPINSLPSDESFAAADPATAEAAYAEAWLAMDYLAQQIGEQAVIEFFRVVAASDDPSHAISVEIPARIGMTLAEFEADWLNYVTTVW